MTKKAENLNQKLAHSLEALLEELFPPTVWDDSATATAQRFVRYLSEYVPMPEPDFALTTFASRAKQIIVVRDIEFSSVCCHHLLPFFGKAHVAYLPDSHIIGLSKIPRLVEFHARRPQTQERLTEDVAKHLKKLLNASGTACIIESVHTCMSCRGVRKVGASMVTSEMRGIFLTNADARHELLSLISLSR